MNNPFLEPGVDYDHDIAAVALFRALGLLPAPEQGKDFFSGAKWVFWTNNPVGNVVSGFLGELADAGLVARTDKGFKWVDGYDPAKFGAHCPQSRTEPTDE